MTSATFRATDTQTARFTTVSKVYFTKPGKFVDSWVKWPNGPSQLNRVLRGLERTLNVRFSPTIEQARGVVHPLLAKGVDSLVGHVERRTPPELVAIAFEHMAVLHEHGTLKDWRDEVSALIGVEFTDAQAAVLNERVRSSFDTDTRRLNAITSVLKSGRPLKLNLLAEAWIRDAELTTLLLPALRAVFETAR